MLLHDGLTYEVSITDAGVISFGAIHGATKKGRLQKHLLYEDEPVLTDVNLTSNPLKLFNDVGKIVIDWVWSNKPHTFSFSSSTDRKVNVYRYLAVKLLKKLPGYTMSEYPVGTFRFYRKM